MYRLIKEILEEVNKESGESIEKLEAKLKCEYVCKGCLHKDCSKCVPDSEE